ncbi:MAG: M67 family metallopeptidase [Chloroflexi bacterium]|nr:M67 family metallopeptidase [Chloroflexota bacterium]
MRNLITLPVNLTRQLQDHVLSQPRVEVCGMLAGTDHLASHIYPVENISDQPTHRFYMHPDQLFQALDEIERNGLSLLAIYHSHPAGARPDPSPDDAPTASWYPNAAQIIAVPSQDGQSLASLRAFRWGRDGFREIELVRISV